MSKGAGCKRKLKTRTIIEKYKILKEVEKGKSSASISKKYGVPKQRLPGWLTGKTKMYSEVEKNKTSAKRVRMRHSPNEDLDKACYMSLLNARNKSIPMRGTISNNIFESCKALWKRVMRVNETNIYFRLFREKMTLRHSDFI